MKTQIIHLDPQDDYFSARDKLSWVKAPRVLLVWPQRGTVLNRKVDLVLLQRECRQLGIQPGLVTFDPDVTACAMSLRIPVFHSLEEAPEADWETDEEDYEGAGTPAQPKRRPDIPATPLRPSSSTPSSPSRWAWFGVTLSALIVLMLALIPSAEVVLPMESTAHTAVVTLPLTIDDADRNGFAVHARAERVIVSGREVVPVTGMVETPVERAQGEVLFTNLTDTRVYLPAGTGVRPTSTSTLRFETTEAVTLAAGPGSSALVPVLAAAAGSNGNLPAGSLTAIEGDLAFSLEVINPSPTSGGTTQLRNGVSAVDQQFARDVVQETLSNAARMTILNRLTSDETLAENHPTLTAVLSEAYDHELGMPTDYLSIAAEAEFEVLVMNQSSLEGAVSHHLESTLPPEETLTEIREIAWDVIDRPSEQMTVEVEYSTRPDVDAAGLRAALRGQTEAAAQAYLIRYFGLLSVPEIRLFPAWLPRLPLLDARISFVWSGASP